MSNLAFLLVAVVVSVVGVGVLVLRTRPPSSSPHASVDEFHDKMRALAPETDSDPRVDDLEGRVVRRRRSRRS